MLEAPLPRTSIPLVDLGALHEPLKPELLAAVERVLESNEFGSGATVREFERAFARSCDAAHCVGVASGLDALRLSLVAAGIEPGDEVLVPAFTFVATFEAVSQAGGVPVPIDVSETDFALDVAALRGVRAPYLIPVHLFGALADMPAVMQLADERGLTVIEDAAQAHGASRDGSRPGERSLAACFSFYPAKNLGALGDAGAVVTNDESLAADLRSLREHGQRAKYLHERIGWTARLDALQAAVLSVKLPYLEQWNRQRALLAARYADLLANVGDLRLPMSVPGSVWHLFVIRTRERDALVAHLRERGIGVGIHYPQPPHLSPAYAHLGYARGAFPVAERLADEVLSLPLYPGMTFDQQDAVVRAVEVFFRGG